MTTLSLTDGSTTVYLSQSNCALLEFTPSAAESDDHGELRSVTETAEVLLTGDQATNAATVRAIRRMLARAQQRRIAGTGARVFAQVQFAGDVNAWRSEVLNGRVEFGQDGAGAWDRNATEVRVHWERVGYWEGSRTALQATSAYSSTPTISAVRVYNNQAGGNWVNFGSAEVGGDLPTPIELRIQATGTWSNPAFYVANTVDCKPDTFQPFVSVDTAAKSGSAGSGLVWTASLSAAQAQACAGQMMRLVLALQAAVSPSAVTWLRPVVYVGAVPVYVGDWSAANAWQIHDLAATPIPAGMFDQAVGAVDVKVELLSSASWSGRAATVLLMPAAMGAYRVLTMPAQMGNGDVLVDDGIEETLYWLPTDNYHYPMASARNAPLLLRPNVTNRLRFLWRNDANYSNGAVDQQFALVQAFYRPRRALI